MPSGSSISFSISKTHDSPDFFSISNSSLSLVSRYLYSIQSLILTPSILIRKSPFSISSSSAKLPFTTSMIRFLSMRSPDSLLCNTNYIILIHCVNQQGYYTGLIGIITVNLEPTSTSLSTLIVPSKFLTMCLTIANPRPVPPSALLLDLSVL